MADLLSSRYNVPVQISTDEKVKGRVNGSVEFLKQHLEKGEVVYGQYQDNPYRLRGTLTYDQASTLATVAAQTPAVATSSACKEPLSSTRTLVYFCLPTRANPAMTLTRAPLASRATTCPDRLYALPCWPESTPSSVATPPLDLWSSRTSLPCLTTTLCP